MERLVVVEVVEEMRPAKAGTAYIGVKVWRGRGTVQHYPITWLTVA